MPPGPSKTGKKGNGWMTKLAFRAARISDSLAERRQANVSFGDAVEQDGTLFAKTIQEGRSRYASKLLRVDAVPDWKICEICCYENRHLLDIHKKAYSCSGNCGKIIVEVVIGCGHCSCALPKDGNLQ
jgi:hypothetical protein